MNIVDSLINQLIAKDKPIGECADGPEMCGEGGELRYEESMKEDLLWCNRHQVYCWRAIQ